LPQDIAVKIMKTLLISYSSPLGLKFFANYNPEDKNAKEKGTMRRKKWKNIIC